MLSETLQVSEGNGILFYRWSAIFSSYKGYSFSVMKWWGTEVYFLIFGLLFKLFIIIYLWNDNWLHEETDLHFCQPLYSLTRNICKQLRNQREKITARFKERSLMNNLLFSIFKKNKFISVFLWTQFYLVQRWSRGVFEVKIQSFPIFL